MIKAERGDIKISGAKLEILTEMGMLLEDVARITEISEKKYKELCKQAWELSRFKDDKEKFRFMLEGIFDRFRADNSEADKLEIRFENEADE